MYTMMAEVAGHNVTKLDALEGANIKIGDAITVTWKAQGKDTGYAFSCYEVSLAPGNGLQLHKHPYAEFFLVLEGTTSFARLNDAGETEWMDCGTGATVLAPPNAPHTFFNRSDRPTRFLGVSTYHHEMMLKQGITPTGTLSEGFPNPTPEGFERLMKSMETNQVYIVNA